MNLLPKSHKEFSEKDYWNKFFKKRGNKAFEWYGEYLELCGHLHKYIKPKDTILITGCGTSSISADLYDVGYPNITNIDVSEVAIKQMTRINSERKSMKFLVMDALNMTFGDEEFSVVLDKGTLDALMPDNTSETKKMIEKYFDEIKRVLKVGGRFVCISLLQSHIMEKLLEVFCDKCWMFRVVRCYEAEQKNAEEGDGTTLPVFIVVATKFKQLPQLILEVCLAGDKMVRMSSPNDVSEAIKSAQNTAFITNGLARTNLDELDQEVVLDLMQPGEDSPRYTVYVVEQHLTPPVNKYAVFIVPQGRESEWLFGTPAGRKQLQESARFGRLVVVALRRGHSFDSLDKVKEELAGVAKTLAPPGFTGQMPFLSIGSDVGSRVLVHSGTSPCSGQFVVEEVTVEDKVFRRLVFLDNQFLVQSEALVKTVKRNKKLTQVIDYGHISLYHAFMSVGVRITEPLENNKIALLGLGGGSLCMFLKKCLPKLRIVAVDLDPAIVDVAKEYFGLIVDELLDVRIQDGLEFLKEVHSANDSFSAILFDMDSKDRSLGLSCPPKQFLEDDVLRMVTAALLTDGNFILNLVCRDTELHDSILETLKRHFKHIVTVKLYEEVNETVFATNGKPYTVEKLGEAARSLNKLAKNKGLVKEDCADVDDFLRSAKIVS